MEAVYSSAVRFGGYGIGHIAYHAALGVYQAGWLSRLFVGSNAQADIPADLISQWGHASRSLKYLASRDPTGLLHHWEGQVFDAWVARKLPAARLFHGWHGMARSSLRRARRLGAVTFLECASAHPRFSTDLLREEYARWGTPLRLPLGNMKRLLQELTTADFITIPSAFVRETMLAAGVAHSKLIEIPFGADLGRFAPAVRNPTASHPFRVIYSGTVMLRKGVPYLLEAWQRLNWHDAELWLAGAVAPEFEPLRRRWAALPGVHFLGHRRDLPELYRQCDVFAFPSLQEGSALVTYEAMASGLPLVTTRNAGAVIQDGVEGYLVPIRDVAALAERLELLRADPALRRQMGRAAEATVRQYTWERYRQQLLQAYRGATGER